MPNSPTIVSASLSDKELQDSINKMVANFDKGLQTMLEHSNEYVGKIQASLQKIGDTNFGAKGSNDGGVAKQTKQHKELTEAVSKETQKLQDLQQSLSGASDREQNFISQKRNAANAIAQENELLQRQENELNNLKNQQQSFVSSEQAKTAALNAHKTAFDVLDAKTKEYLSTQERLLQKGSGITPNERKLIGIDQQTLSLIERAKRELESFNLTLSDGTKYAKDPFSSRFQSLEILKKEIDNNIRSFEQWKKETRLTTDDVTKIDAILQKYKEYSRIIDELRSKEANLLKNHDVSKFTDDFSRYFTQRVPLIRADESYQDAYWNLQKALSQTIQTEQQKAQIDAQVAAKEKEIAETKGRIATATKEQTEADKNANQAAKEKANIQSQVANQEKQVAEAKKQLTTATQQHAEAETKSSRATKEKTMTLDQQASAINTAVQSQKKYTDEIRKQAAAIRATKEWQEKGHVVIGDVNYYDKERANVSKRDKQILLSLEEQIVQAQQREAQEALVAAEAKRQQAQASKEAAQADSKTKTLYNYDYTKSVARAGQIGTTNSQEVNYLKTQIADLLGIQEREVQMINVEKASYGELSSYIKQLQTAYKNLGNDIAGRHGKDIADELQRAQRELQKYQAQMSRPTSLKAAMGLSEKTLDDIAYKMRQLASYRSGLNISTQRGEISQVNAEYERLKKRMDEVMQKNQNMIASNTALGRSWNYMKNRLAFYFTVGASTQFVKNLIEVRSQYEMNERALGILIDSAERGTQIFNELSQMALVSPYTLIELSTAAKQLTAYDVAAKDVVDTTRRLADMAAAVGIPIERLTYALGQIKAYGYLNSRDARMFANAGIPLVKQLSEYYTELEGRLVSTADVYDRIKKKAIDYNEVMEVINKMTDKGGKFFDFQAKMADTLKVRLANLTLAWNNMLNEIGKSNQGILTFGIGALKELFLQWKKFSSAIYSAAWAGGLVIAIRALNVLLVKAGFNFRILSKDMTAAGIAGQGLATKMRTLGSSIASVAKSSLTWWSLLAFAVVDAAKDLYYMNEAQENLNKSIRDGAKDNYDNISKFLEQYKEVRDSLYSTKNVAIGSIYNPTTKKAEATAYAEQQVGQDIDKNEAKKAWEAIREQIELTSQSSDVYISKLLTIENMSERVRQGFNLLDDIQVVNSALKELDDNTIKITQDYSAWWNVWQAPDGLITNLKDLEESEKRLLSVHSSVQEAFTTGHRIDLLQDYLRDLERLREDLKVTTDSILNFIELKGWSGDEGKINQVFEQITQKLILDNQLDPQKAFTLQTEVEEARSKAAKQALLQRINDEKAALKIANDDSVREALAADIERYKNWDETNGRSKVEWERFTKWLKEQHISETTQMFRNMDAEDIKSLNFQEGKHAEWVTRMVTQYAKEHKMSYDEAFKYLKSWVTSANQWSIFLPLIISTEDKKSVYDQLGEYDKAIDDADSQIERLTRRIGELRAKRKLDKEELRELVHAQRELTDAEEAKAEAEAKGGHGKKEKKDEKAARKAAAQAESELQKALKDELSTIDKVRSIYKELTKEGMSHADAVERATRGWGETVNAINRVLQKNGLQKLDLSKFAGIENPRELVNMLQSQLDILVKRGAKAAEIKELQAKIQTLNVDADKYDLTRITKGLNSELDKLKDEYELAVELDADPELGNMFVDMFGIDRDALTTNVYEVVRAMQESADRAIQGFVALNPQSMMKPFDLLRDDLKTWADETGTEVGGKLYTELERSQKQVQDMMRKYWTDIDKQTRDLQYKLADTEGKIAIENEKLELLQQRLAKETTEEKRRLLKLQIKDQQNAIAKIKEEVLQMLPTYKALYSSIIDHSAQVTRRIAKEWQGALRSAVKNPDGTWTVTDPRSGQKATMTEKEYGKQIDKVNGKLRETAPIFDQIKEALTKGEDGEVDFYKGLELICGEAKKAADGLKEMAEILGALGASGDTTEAINDIAASIEGVSKAAEGYAKIQSGDVIGGTVDMVTGIYDAVSTWFDNDNKRIDRYIKDSERAVKRLELAYIDLEHAVEKAYGMATIGANMAAKANKELQLVELKRQLALERSRDSKNRDEDKIIDLQKQIKELEYDIADTVDSIVNDLLGISSVGDAMENLMDGFIEALRSGEDAMATFDESVDEMIANMVKKMFTTKILQPWFEEQWNKIQNQINERAGKLPEELAKAQSKVSEAKMADLDDNDSLVGALRALGMSDDQIHLLNWYNEFGQYDWGLGSNARLRAAYEKMLKEAEQKEAELQKELTTATMPTTDDIRQYAELLRSGKPIMEENMQEVANFLRELGLMKDTEKDKALSALQQGLQGVSEETASAVEAYLNGMSQQAYLRNDLLVQIRDTIMSFDMDVQLGVFSQMLLQLQNNYIVMQSMQSMMENWTVPSGSGIRVELMS